MSPWSRREAEDEEDAEDVAEEVVEGGVEAVIMVETVAADLLPPRLSRGEVSVVSMMLTWSTLTLLCALAC